MQVIVQLSLSIVNRIFLFFSLFSSVTPAAATPRTVFALTDAVGGGQPGSARIISTPFVTRNSNAVPGGNKLFAALYPAMLAQNPLRASTLAAAAVVSPSSASPEDSYIQSHNVLHTNTSVLSVLIDYLGSSATFLNSLSGRSLERVLLSRASINRFLTRTYSLFRLLRSSHRVIAIAAVVAISDVAECRNQHHQHRHGLIQLPHRRAQRFLGGFIHFRFIL